MYLVYKLIREDGKEYIGISRNNRFKNRLREHRSTKRFNKLKFSNEVLMNNISYKEARKLEHYYITLFDTYKNGLNRSKDGAGNHSCPAFTTYGYKFSEESRKKMSVSAKKAIAEGRKKIWNKGVKNCYSKECLEKKSKKMKGRQLYTKINKDTVLEIRSLYENKSLGFDNVGIIQRNGIPMSYLQAFAKHIAPKYNLSPQCIKKIIKRETWYNV